LAYTVTLLPPLGRTQRSISSAVCEHAHAWLSPTAASPHRTPQVSFLKFNPLCYVHVFLFGMLLAALRARLDPLHSRREEPLGDGSGCDPLCLNSVKPATDADDGGERTAVARLRRLALVVSQYGACLGCVRVHLIYAA
jgi:hypothetical protein